MPRITNDEHLRRHQDVQQLWLSFPKTFIVLSPTDQWRVHDYYQTQSTAPDDKILFERDRLSKEQPSLPQAAGKAYRMITRCFGIANNYSQGNSQQFFRALMSLTTSEQPRLKHHAGISIHPLVRLAPDIELLTQAFIRFAGSQHDYVDHDLDQAA